MPKPGSLVLDGEKYVAVVLKINDRCKDGRIQNCMVLHDDQTIHLEGGEEFMIVYAPAKMLQPQN